MSLINKPDYEVFASNARDGEVLPIPDVLRGWGETILLTEKIPPMEWFNWLAKRQDEWLLYLTQQGIAEWSDKVTYPNAAIAKFNGLFYVSIKETTGDNPSVTQSAWKLLTEYFNIDGKLDKTEVKQTIGQSATSVMSQKAITDALGKKLNITDLPIARALLRKRGYWVCPSTGFMIQWATEDARSSGTYTYQLPEPFPNEGLFAVGNVGSAVHYNNDNASGSVGDLTKTTIRVTMDNNLPTAWIAIGY